jgi:hypothetical protein
MEAGGGQVEQGAGSKGAQPPCINLFRELPVASTPPLRRAAVYSAVRQADRTPPMELAALVLGAAPAFVSSCRQPGSMTLI